MGAIANIDYYDKDGYLIQSLSVTLPEFLDWKSIEEKEVYMRYIGGFPTGTHLALLQSQGQRRILLDVADSITNEDANSYRSKNDGAEQYIEERCRELGIERTRVPRNQ